MTTTITRSPRTRVTSRVNRCRNPKCGTNSTDWSGTANGSTPTAARVNGAGGGPAAVGDFWLRVTLTAASTYMDARNGGAGVNLVTAGQPYTASAYMRPTSATASTATVYLQWYDASGTLLSTSTSVGQALASGWTRVSGTDVAPSGAVRVVTIFRAVSASAYASGDRLDVTGILIDGTTGLKPYFDGDTANVGTTVYSWSGTANASTSLEVIDNPADVFTPQLMTKWDMQRPSKSNAIGIPGASGPVIAYHPMSKRTGQLAFLLGLEPAAAAFDALLSQQAAFVLTDTDRPLVSMTFAVVDGSLRITLDEDTRRLFVGSADVKEL